MRAECVSCSPTGFVLFDEDLRSQYGTNYSYGVNTTTGDSCVRECYFYFKTISVAWHTTVVFSLLTPCVLLRCRKNFSQWQRSFQWKLRSHWLKFLRQHHIAVFSTGPSIYMYHNLALSFRFGTIRRYDGTLDRKGIERVINHRGVIETWRMGWYWIVLSLFFQHFWITLFNAAMHSNTS